MAKLRFKIFTIEPGNPAKCKTCHSPVRQDWYVIANYEVDHSFTLDWVFESQIVKFPLGRYASEKNAKRALYKGLYRKSSPHEIELDVERHK